MRNSNYPLYETTVFRDFRVMTENVANKYPDRIALAFRVDPKDEQPVEITFEQARCDIRHYGTALHDIGCCDKHCAIIGGTSCGWVYTYFTLMSIGAVTVPIDKDWPADDLCATVNKAKCEYVFYDGSIKAKVEQMREQCGCVSQFICINGKTIGNDTDMRSLIDYGAELYAAGDTTYYDYEIDPDRLASIVFTSGTTGKGKGVMLSQTNIVSDMTQGMYNFAITDNTLCLLPPHHTFCSTINFVGHFSQGSTVYLSSGLRYMAKEMKERQPTHLLFVPLFLQKLYKKIWSTAEKNGQEKTLRQMMKLSNGMRKVGIDMRKKMFASILDMFGGKLEFIICGGAALPQDIIDTFDAIGITILNGYGITECSPLISCNRNKLQKPGSVGTPIIGELVKIKDPDENGEGEICVKGTNVMLGYYEDPEATAAVFDEEGYFRTGDYGKLDDEGWVYITGRLKNLIIFSNGKNVYPEEIENAISGVPGVEEVVVYAGESKSNPEKEVIVAEIFPDFAALESRGITDVQKYFSDEVKRINAEMPSYKSVGLVKIRQVEFIKNTSKKITRFNIDKTID